MIVDKILDGHCQATFDLKAQNRWGNNCPEYGTGGVDLIGLCKEDGWDRDFHKLEPDLCIDEIRQCPSCKIWLCIECWYAHDPYHFVSFGGLYAGEIVPMFHDVFIYSAEEETEFSKTRDIVDRLLDEEYERNLLD